METPQNKRKREEEADDVQSFLMNVEEQWTPGRAQRSVKNKVRSAADGPLMGGDWVLNSDGGGATLSFCFKAPGGNDYYGLTVGRLVTSVGDPVFCFAESEPIPVPSDEGEPEYFMFEIGEVTSISKETDSAIFKLNLERDQCMPLDIAVSDESTLSLGKMLPLLTEDSCQKGSIVVGFGAQRRGAQCVVHEPSAHSKGMFSFFGDIGIKHFDPVTSATDGGDCGAIFVSQDTGMPVYFHHVLSLDSNQRMLSYGVPLMSVLKAHQETRHLIRPQHSSSDLRTMHEGRAKGEFKSPPRSKAHQVSGLHQFKTRIVDPTFDGAKRFVSRGPEKDCPSFKKHAVAPWDVTKSTQERNLPVFSVRVVDKPTRG